MGNPYPQRRSLFNRFLDLLERGGNKLPDPVFIFISLCALILLAGVNISEVNRIVKQFEQMKKMMKQLPSMMKNKKRGGLGGLFGGGRLRFPM